MRTRSRRASVAPAARAPAKAAPALVSVVVGVLALGLDLVLAPPVTGDQDASELTLALATGGVPHPSGYPLYAWLGHGFVTAVHAAGATWSYAANAWSALGAAVAIGLFHALAVRAGDPQAPGDRGVRLGAALVVTAIAALHPVWTMVAALAEVHSWHLAWAAGLTLLFITTVRGLSGRAPWSDRSLAAAALGWGGVCGIGLAHHMTGVLLALPLTVALVMAVVRAQRWRWTFPVAALAGAALPIASYGFVLWRAFHPAVFQWPMLEPSLASAVRHVLGGGYGRYFGHFAPADIQVPLLTWTVYPLLFTGLALLAFAIWRARPGAERLVRAALLAAALLQTAVVFEYGVPDPASYFLPAIWIVLLVVPIGIAALRSRAAAQGAVLAGAIGAVALAVPWLRQGFDRRAAFVVVDTHLHGVWRGIPADSGIVLWPRDMYCRFREYQLFDGEKPGLYVSSPNLLTFDAPRQEFIERFGFDPLADLHLRSAADLGQVAENINRRTSLPVIVVDRFGFAATVLPKTPTSKVLSASEVLSAPAVGPPRGERRGDASRR